MTGCCSSSGFCMKRLFDIIGAVAMILLLLPVMIFLLFIVRWVVGAPVFFKQFRPGLNGKVFELIKFRTMKDEFGNNGQKLPDEERIVPLGKFLRSTSLDELPSLWNVLKGDMSLIGPRPLLPEYLPLYSKKQARRHEVKPGITGWAQVNGRNAISWEEKFKLDVWYVDNQSFWLDIKILFLTVKKVLMRDGISAEGHATIEPFKGTES